MFDKRLLEVSYPCKGSAYVEDRLVRNPYYRTGHRMSGKWINGVAVGVYHVGKTPLFVVFVATNGEEYLLDLRVQLKPYTG